jgi:hypothetical protein
MRHASNTEAVEATEAPVEVVAEAEEVQETTAERLTRELREKFQGERIQVQFEQGVINPIELAKFMSVRPQMVYQDIRSGRLTAAKHNNTQKWVIDRSIAIDYAAAYLDRKAQRLLQLQREQEEALSKAS